MCEVLGHSRILCYVQLETCLWYNSGGGSSAPPGVKFICMSLPQCAYILLLCWRERKKTALQEERGDKGWIETTMEMRNSGSVWKWLKNQKGARTHTALSMISQAALICSTERINHFVRVLSLLVILKWVKDYIEWISIKKSQLV